MHRGKAIFYTSIAAILLFGCEDSKKVAEKPAAEVIYSVEIGNAYISTNQTIISSTGTIRFRRETSLGFTTSGKVQSVKYNEGDRVKRGALLAALDNTIVNADTNVARAELERARSQYDRIAKLFDQGWVTKAQLEQSQAAFEAASARVDQARFNANTSRLFAPSNGIIISRDIDPGQIVAAGSAALTFGQIDSGYILRVPITAENALKLNVGMPVSITVSSINNIIFDGQISEIDGQADVRTGSFIVTVQLPVDSRLQSGQIANADFQVASDKGAISVPASAISGIRGSEAVIYIYDNESNTAKVRNVNIGPLSDNEIQIIDGLAAGEPIIIRGHEKLINGSKVKTVDRGKANNNVKDFSDTAPIE